MLAREPEKAFLESDLSAEECAWLLAVDKRAFLVNPDVARQTLAVMAKEIDVPVALTIHAGRGSLLFGFFSNPRFHRAVQRGESLTAAFCDYLMELALDGEIPDWRLAHVTRLFQMTTRMAHGVCGETDVGRGELQLAPSVDFDWFPNGILELVSSARVFCAGIHGTQDMTLDAKDGLGELPMLDDQHKRPVMVEVLSGSRRELRTSYIESELAELLTYTRPPGCSRSTLLEKADELGVMASNDEEIITQLVEDGLILTN